MTSPPQYGAPITLEAAKRVMAAAETEANANGWPMVIAIVDTGGHLMMLHRIDHAQNGSVEIARRKAETAVNFKRPTKVFEDAIAQGGMHLRKALQPPSLAGWSGLGWLLCYLHLPAFLDGGI